MSDIFKQLGITAFTGFFAGTFIEFIHSSRTIQNLLESMMNGLIWVGVTVPISCIIPIIHNDFFRAMICMVACLYILLSKSKPNKNKIVQTDGVTNINSKIGSQSSSSNYVKTTTHTNGVYVNNGRHPDNGSYVQTTNGLPYGTNVNISNIPPGSNISDICNQTFNHY